MAMALLGGLLAASLSARAAPELSINMLAEKEVVVVEDGEEVVKRVPTLQIESGARLYFTLEVVNSGDETATNVVVDNPIPAQTRYVEGSAAGSNAVVMFSIDNGESWAGADELLYDFTTFDGEKEKRRARPDMYTDIRWVVQSIAPAAEGELVFQVQVD